MKREKENKRPLSIVGVILIFISICMLIYYCEMKDRMIKKEDIDIGGYIEETSMEESQIVEKEEAIEVKKQEQENYSMILEIPSVGLKKGIYDVNSKRNNVSSNIQLLKNSDMPNITNGNLLFASHNGNSSVSYFKNLSKVEIGDEINIYHSGIKYTYNLDSFYDIEKNGTVRIHRDNNKTTIVLITCKKNTKNIQTVYIGYLNSKSEY